VKKRSELDRVDAVSRALRESNSVLSDLPNPRRVLTGEEGVH
jgi:hypothetical protein